MPVPLEPGRILVASDGGGPLLPGAPKQSCENRRRESNPGLPIKSRVPYHSATPASEVPAVRSSDPFEAPVQEPRPEPQHAQSGDHPPHLEFPPGSLGRLLECAGRDSNPHSPKGDRFTVCVAHRCQPTRQRPGILPGQGDRRESNPCLEDHTLACCPLTPQPPSNSNQTSPGFLPAYFRLRGEPRPHMPPAGVTSLRDVCRGSPSSLLPNRSPFGSTCTPRTGAGS